MPMRMRMLMRMLMQTRLLLRSQLILVALLSVFTTAVRADVADVISAQATQSRDGTWRVDATIAHADTGWDHYANGFEVLTPDGTLLATRVLHHPHVNEQPFTRSVSVTIPAGIKQVIVRAQDSVHGQGGAQLTIDLN